MKQYAIAILGFVLWAAVVGCSKTVPTEIHTTAGWAGGNSMDLQSRAERVAEERWSGTRYRRSRDGSSLVRSVSRIDSGSVSHALKRCALFRVVVENQYEALAGPPSYSNTIVFFEDGSLVVFDQRLLTKSEDKAAADLLSSYGKKPQGEVDVRWIVESFAALRGFELVGEQPEAVHPLKDIGPEDWKFVISATEDGWEVGTVFEVDPFARSCVQYHFSIDRTGRVDARVVKALSPMGLYS